MEPASPGWWTADARRRAGRPAIGSSIDGGEPRADPRARRLPDGPDGPSAVFDAARSLDRPRVARRRRSPARSSTSCTSARSPPRARSMPRSTRLDHLVDARRRLGRGDADRHVPRPARLGLRRGRPLRRARALRRAGRASAASSTPAMQRGLGVCLDVVYNHLGPSGNHLERVRAVLHRPLRHAVGRGAQPRRRRQRRGPPLRHRQRADVAAPTSTSTACGSTPCTRCSTTEPCTLLEELASEVGALAVAASGVSSG